jgi:hypothetical protein
VSRCGSGNDSSSYAAGFTYSEINNINSLIYTSIWKKKENHTSYFK